MDRNDRSGRAERFAAFVDDLAGVLGDARRAGPLTSYCTGLLLPAERKSVEPMAALTAPRRTAAQHQSMLHFVGQGDWSDEAVMERIRAHALPAIEAHGAITSWIIDDTGFPKKGKHSVGVARQYCGQLGKQDNCQVAVSLSIANDHASLPVAYRLYLPQSWIEDRARRAKAGVPDDIAFATKPQIALAQIRWACEAGLPRGVVLCDSGYGVETRFRSEVTALDLKYVAGVKSNTTVWAPGASPCEGPARSPRRRRPEARESPVTVEQLARRLPNSSWRKIAWREGTNERLASRFARIRVRPAHDRDTPIEEVPQEWLLIEWPLDEKEPMKFWLSTLGATITFAHLVHMTKQRWRIERDYLELKQEVGLGHFEGRGWRGFHHHATLCIAAYAFLVSERAAFPPCEARCGGIVEISALPEDFRPRGAAASNRAPRAGFDRDAAA
ncbi:MAG: IS701 family transposase [Panacagrimonas sp.]